MSYFSKIKYFIEYDLPLFIQVWGTLLSIAPDLLMFGSDFQRRRVKYKNFLMEIFFDIPLLFVIVKVRKDSERR